MSRPSFTSSICCKCYQTFILTDDEVSLIPDRDFSNKQPKKICDILTWDDWTTHVLSHCRECRLDQPPPSCVDDLNQKMTSYYKKTGELEKQIALGRVNKQRNLIKRHTNNVKNFR